MIRVRHQVAALVVLLLVLSGANAQASASGRSTVAAARAQLATFAASDVGSGEIGVGIWHRYSPGASASQSEHERMVCVPVREGVVMSCHYDKAREQELGYHWDDNQGYFQGADVTDSWSAPGWFPAGISGSVTRVVEGQFVYVNPGVHAPFFVNTDLVFTGSGPTARMYVYWINQFVCPWFKTFEQALAANPGGAPDCTPAS